RGFESKTVISFLECFEQKSNLLGGAGRVKTDQTDRRARSENRDHDRLFVYRVHENMAAVSLVIEGIEFDLADPPCQFACGGKGTSSQRRDNRHVHDRHIAILGDK